MGAHATLLGGLMCNRRRCRILGEDKVMVEKLRPELLQREVNVKADGVQTAFRKVRCQLPSDMLAGFCVSSQGHVAGSHGFVRRLSGLVRHRPSRAAIRLQPVAEHFLTDAR